MKKLLLIVSLCAGSMTSSFCAMPAVNQPAQVRVENAPCCASSTAKALDACIKAGVPCFAAGILLTTVSPLLCASACAQKAASFGAGCCMAGGFNLGRAIGKRMCSGNQPQQADEAQALMVRN